MPALMPVPFVRMRIMMMTTCATTMPSTSGCTASSAATAPTSTGIMLRLVRRRWDAAWSGSALIRMTLLELNYR